MAAVTREAAGATPAGGGQGDAADAIDPRLRDRLRVLFCCLSLVLLATATRPGKIVADTKIDMAINPVGFLGRALHLWDIEQFGQLQNQAAGYLFPMGPFYALGHLAGIPAWITQRMWLGLLLCLAFLGTRRLAERLGLGTPGGRLAGAMAYALSPHALGSLGTNSSEYLPLALLPWIILPLATVTRRDPAPRRGSGRITAAARSGLAVACCGGINGTAVFAVLAVAGLFVLTRPRGTPRFRLLGWWCAAVAVATAWWSVPLVLLGRYAFSWLTYTEKASTTTSTTGLVQVLRGGERWVNALFVNGDPWWPLGHVFATETLPILATGAVAALGVAGLARRGLPERTFLLTTLLIGVVVLVAGHAGPLAGETRHLIDGPLAPFRNLYKFDGMVRLPLALGVVQLFAPVRARWSLPGMAAARTLVTLVALAGVAAPTLSTGLSAKGDFPAVPQYWREATTWLNGHAGDQGVIAVPGARFGEYLWGRPMDEITQPLMRARWAERQLVPSGSPGLTRLMDAIDQRFTSGRGSAGLSRVLARMGVRYILVRNDLRRDDLRGAWPARVHQALDSSPGIRRAVWFGGVPAGGTYPDDAVGLFDQPYPPVEVYEVAGADSLVSMTGADQALRVYGSPEAMLTMADSGLLSDRPVLLNDDEPQAPGRAVVADSLRRVQRNFGELRGQTSPTMTAGQDAGVPPQQRDIMDDSWDRYSTVAAYRGIDDVTASSSSADADSIVQLADPTGLPYAAIDGNPWTQWETGGWHGPVGQWLRIDFGRSLAPRNVTVTFAQNPWLGPPPDRVAVVTQAGRAVQSVARIPTAQPLRVPAGPTTWLRIEILSLAGHPAVAAAARVAVPELHIDGVHATRYYRVPATPGDGTVVMARGPGRLTGCMQGSVRWVCSPALQRGDEEGYRFIRVLTRLAAAKARLTGTAALTDTSLVQKYLSTDPRLSVTASSTATSEPAGTARSAFDDDPATTWVPANGDTDPSLSLSWRRRLWVGLVTIKRPPGVSGGLLQVRVEGDRGQWRQGLIGPDGKLSFQAMRTTRLTLRFPGESPQITDVAVPGVRPFRSPRDARVPLRCGLGPRLRVNGATVLTRARGTFGDLLAGRAIRFAACRVVRLRAGANTLTAAPFDAFRVDSAVLDPVGGVAAAPPVRAAYVQVTRWTTEDRRVEVNAERDSYLVVNENQNPGWRATVGGRTLRPVRLDGWRQAWLVPAGTIGTVRLSYQPGRVYRTAVFGGLGILPLLLLVALWPARLVPLRVRTAPAGERAVAVRGRVIAFAGDVAGVLVAAGIGYWVGGLVGTGVAAVAAALTAWPPPRTATVLRSPWAAAGAMFAATAVSAAGVRMTGAHAALVAETVPRLLCLFVVARLAVALTGAAGRRTLSGTPPPRGQAQDRTFEQVERDGRDGHRQQRDDRELQQEVAGERSVLGQVVPAGGNGHLPEEDPVGDAAQEPHDAVAEERPHDGVVGGGEGDRRDGEGGHQAVQQEPELGGPDGVERGEVGRPGDR
jgi:arabinofuranan 3-O-arabinosyltransferase